MKYASNVISWMLVNPNNMKSLCELIYGEKLIFKNLQIFGSIDYVHRESQRSKRANEGIEMNRSYDPQVCCVTIPSRVEVASREVHGESGL